MSWSHRNPKKCFAKFRFFPAGEIHGGHLVSIGNIVIIIAGQAPVSPYRAAR